MFFLPSIGKFGTCTVGENIIATTKILNNYSAIQSFIFKECKRATTIAVVILIVGRVITIWEAIQKRSHEPI